MLNLYHLKPLSEKGKNQNTETKQADTIDTREMGGGGGLWKVGFTVEA